MHTTHKYIPALGQDWLTPLYDPLLKWVMREEHFKRQLIRQARIEPGQRVLDVGCGTATLALLIKQIQPEAAVVGLDGDAKILEIGRRKVAQAGIEITLDQGLASQLPYSDNRFDRVLSSLVWHHLNPESKRRATREVFRVLRPGGEFHLVDFGKPHTPAAYLISRLMIGAEEARDNIQGLLPAIFSEAGFAPVAEVAWMMTFFGTLSFYQARKPG